MKMENLVISNGSTCYIKPRLPYFPNGSYLDFDSCPEHYNKSTKPLIEHCCLTIIYYALENTSYRQIQDWLTYNSSALLVLPAIFFNLLSFLVLSRFSKLNPSATSINFYMQCLCIFDTLTVLTKYIHEFVVVRNSIRDMPFVFDSNVCRATHFSESVFGITSIYILILMSFDKLICVALPLKSGSLLRPKRAKFMGALIFILATFYSSYHIFNQEVYNGLADSINQNSSENNQNSSQPIRVVYDCIEKDRKLADKMKIVDNVVRVFLPILLLCLCNLSIAIVLAKARKNAMTYLSESTNDSACPNKFNNKIVYKKSINKNDDTTQAEEILLRVPKTSGKLNKTDSQNTLSVNDDTASINSSEKSNRYMKDTIFQNNKSKHERPQYSLDNSVHNTKAKKNSNYISLMLFAVSLGFVLFNLPFAIKTIYETKFKEKLKAIDYLYGEKKTDFTKTDIVLAVRYDFFVYITHFLLDLNYIANFFFYFLSGSRFRTRLYALFRCQGTCNENFLKNVEISNKGGSRDRQTFSTTTKSNKK